VGIAAHLVYGSTSWWLAGLAGAAVSVVWNYAMSSIFTWSARPAAVPATLPQGVQPAAPLPGAEALLPR
jgi:hypothetical protein